MMNDRNGKEIKVGVRAVLLKGWTKSDNGRVGEIRAISLTSPALHGKPAVRITEGPDDEPLFSAWVSPYDVAVV
jgi:hypothetical protein